MPLDINMLGARVETGVLSKCNSTLIVCFDENWSLREAQSNIKFGEQPSKLNGFLSCLRLSYILGLT